MAIDEPIAVRPGVLVPPSAIHWTSVTSGGPGGQNVNKVASRVVLRVALAEVVGLDEASLARVREKLANRLDGDGNLLVTASETRDRGQNLRIALEKVRELLAAALFVPKKRRPTRPTRGSQERRLGEKKRQGEKKVRRRQGDD